MKLKNTPWKESYVQPRQHIKRHHLASKDQFSQSYGFSSSQVWMWELNHKEGWWFWTVLLKKTLESPLDYKEIKTVNPKGNQSWIFIGRTDAEAEAPILWLPDVKSQLVGKDPDAGKDWRWEEKGMTEDEMVGWHHWLNGHEFEQALGVGDGQGGLACCSPWGHKKSDTTEQLNWTPSSDLPCCMVLFLAFCVLGCLCILKNPCGWGESALPGRPALRDRKGYSWEQAFDKQSKQPKAHVPRSPARQ